MAMENIMVLLPHPATPKEPKVGPIVYVRLKKALKEIQELVSDYDCSSPQDSEDMRATLQMVEDELHKVKDITR
jgi:hypothetical protein